MSAARSSREKERICARCGEPLQADPLHNVEMGELCMTCTEFADEERFQRQWRERWQRYVGTAWEAVTRAATEVGTERELEVLDALLWHKMDFKGAAERLDCSRATVKKHHDSLVAKCQEHEAVRSTKLPTRRESSPPLPRHWYR